MRRKISLKEYLSNEINVRIWREIEKESSWKTLFKQKPLFDRLHKEFDFFTDHAHSYGEITKHFTMFNINGDKQKKYVFLFFLLVFIEHHYYEVDLNNGVTQESYLFIKDLCEKSLVEFHTVKTDNTTSERNGEALEDYNKLRHNEVTIEIYEKQNQLIDKFQETKTLSKEDIESGIYPNFTERQQIKINPAIPSDPKEAFQLFKIYYAAFQFETYKSLFFDTYRSFENQNAINAEIKIIEDFIKDAENLSYKDACSNLNNKERRYEFRRLTGGFYNDYLMTWEQHNLNSVAASVYGEYILLYDYLKNQLAKPGKIKDNLTSNEIYKSLLDKADAALKKDPASWRLYYNALLSEITLVKDNYILAFQNDLDQGKIKDYDFQIERAINRLSAIEQIINNTGLENLSILNSDEKLIDNAMETYIPEIGNEILSFLKQDLKKRCAAYLQKIGNPLATEVDYIDLEIKQCKIAIENLIEANNKHHHGQASPLESERITWLNKLKIAEALKEELQFPKPSKKPKPLLTLRQIALICHYNGETVTRINGKEIAKKFNQNSGDGIFNHFTYYQSRANRIGAEKTDKKNSNKVELFESLLQYFDSNIAIRAKVLDDFSTFKAAI